jgi:hypothetical protein
MQRLYDPNHHNTYLPRSLCVQAKCQIAGGAVDCSQKALTERRVQNLHGIKIKKTMHLVASLHSPCPRAAVKMSTKTQHWLNTNLPAGSHLQTEIWRLEEEIWQTMPRIQNRRGANGSFAIARPADVPRKSAQATNGLRWNSVKGPRRKGSHSTVGCGSRSNECFKSGREGAQFCPDTSNAMLEGASFGRALQAGPP